MSYIRVIDMQPEQHCQPLKEGCFSRKPDLQFQTISNLLKLEVKDLSNMRFLKFKIKNYNSICSLELHLLPYLLVQIQTAFTL